MKVTVLGTSGAYPGPDQACTGFLIQEDNTNLLLDCGTGVLANLQKFVGLTEVTDIVISHMHADHFFDLIPFRYALRYGLEKPEGNRPRLFLPPEGIQALSQVVQPFSESADYFSGQFEMSEYQPGETGQIGPFSVAYIPVKHYVPTYGMTIEGNKKLAYSSDTGACPEMERVAKDADLFICHIGACLGDRDDLWGHLRPDAAGELARKAGAKRLLLTHLWPACDRETSRIKASLAFGGPVEMAESCQTYIL